MGFFAILLGVFFGCAAALFIVSIMVKDSNDLGNTKGDFDDFSRGSLNLIIKQDRIKRPKF